MTDSNKRFWGMSLVLVAFIGLGIGICSQVPHVVTRLSYAAESGRAQAAKEQLAGADAISHSFKDVAKAMVPSVVSIQSVTRVQLPPGMAPGGPRGFGLPPGLPEEFRDFFGDDRFERFGPMPQEEGRERERMGMGSGVIVSDDGYIVTNNHVVQGATELKVSLFDGRTFDAKVVGTDAKTDLAVLKVEATNLVAADFGDSDLMEVGDWVLAVGSPFELHHTVTSGIVSAKGRTRLQITDYEDFIQTDAAINPGNSGGPLCNLRGEVVGICTAIAGRSGGFQGIGFAIPSNMVSMVRDAIIRQGRVQRGQLGAMIQDMNEELAESFGFDSTDSVLIGDVLPDSPAEKAGLKSGDIVVEYQGKAMKSADQLRKAVAATPPDTNAKVTVFRGGEKITIDVRIGELPDEPLVAERRDPGRGDDVLGLVVEPVTPDVAGELGMPANTTGVVVTQVRPGSLGARLGLTPGDAVLMVGDKPIGSVADFRETLTEDAVSRGIRLQIMRDGVRRFLFLRASR
jgi:serine protease Do